MCCAMLRLVRTDPTCDIPWEKVLNDFENIALFRINQTQLVRSQTFARRRSFAAMKKAPPPTHWRRRAAAKFLAMKAPARAKKAQQIIDFGNINVLFETKHFSDYPKDKHEMRFAGQNSQTSSSTRRSWNSTASARVVSSCSTSTTKRNPARGWCGSVSMSGI